MTGRFITFEGIEGCGKTTQIDLLREHLEKAGRPVVVTREPGGTAIAEAIRGVLLDPAHEGMAHATEILLYEAARAQLVNDVIRPALTSGAVVLCDRFADSTTAYQGAGRGLPIEHVLQLHHFATQGIWPHLTIVLDLPAKVGLERARARGRFDRIEQESLDFHERVRQGFLALAKQEPGRIRIVDATQSIEAIAAVIRGLAETVIKTVS